MPHYAEKYQGSCRLTNQQRVYNQDLTELERTTKCFS